MEARLAQAFLEDEWTRSVWIAFAQSTVETHRDHAQLKQRVLSSLPIFHELSRKFVNGRGCNGASLMSAIDNRLMRRHLLASRFLQAMFQVGADDRMSQLSQIEVRRLDQVVAEARGRIAMALRRYRQLLDTEAVNIRTQRLYLRAALEFLSGVGFDGAVLHGEDLLRHLRKHPGHAASLTRFVRFCRESLTIDIAMPPRVQYQRTIDDRIARQVKELKTALQTWRGRTLEHASARDIARVLSAAIDIPAAELFRRRNEVRRAADGAINIFESASFQPADKLYRFADRWLELSVGARRAGESRRSRSALPK